MAASDAEPLPQVVTEAIVIIDLVESTLTSICSDGMRSAAIRFATFEPWSARSGKAAGCVVSGAPVTAIF